MTEAEFKQRVTNSKQILSLIIDGYVREGSPKEINITVRIRKPLMDNYKKGNLSPEILAEASDHILNLLRWNQRAKFLALAQGKSQNSSLTSMSSVSDSKRKVGTKKATIKQVVMDELPPPHSLEDFKALVKKEFVEESLLFLLSIIEYHKIASPYYPTSLLTHNNLPVVPEVAMPFKPNNVSQIIFETIQEKLKASCLQIRDTYIVSNAEREVNLTQKERKAVLAEIDAGNYHPEIWKTSFEHIANLLRVNVLGKFLD